MKHVLSFLSLFFMLFLLSCEAPTIPGSDSSDTSFPHLAPTGVLYSDTDKTPGLFGGDILLGRALDESDISGYRLYWGTDGYTKSGGPIADLNASESLVYTFSPGTAVDNDITHLLAYSYNESGENPYPVSCPIEDYAVYTLYELRDSDDSAFPGLPSIVEVENIVVSANDGNRNFWAQESDSLEYGGIMFYLNGTFPLPDSGETISFKGTLSEYLGTIQISELSSLNIEQSPAPEITPAVMALADISHVDSDIFEKYESLLVKVENVQISSAGGAVPGYFLLNNSLKVDDRIFNGLNASGYEENDFFLSIIGILARDSEGVVLLPRSEADFTPSP